MIPGSGPLECCFHIPTKLHFCSVEFLGLVPVAWEVKIPASRR